MGKVLLAMDATNPDRGALEFACYLAKLTNSKLTGVFLENELPFLHTEIEESPGYSAKVEVIEKNIERFRQNCVNDGASCKVYRDRGVPAKDLIAKSRFADLLIIDSETSFEKRSEGSPTDFVRLVLRYAECPVIIAPESFDGI